MPLGFDFYMHTRDRRNLETVIPPCFVGESRHQSTLFVGCAWYSGANVELVKSLGGDNVIDYTREDFTKNTETHDLIFDAVGATTFDRCKHLLEPQGIFLSCIMGLPDVARSLCTSIIGRKKMRGGVAINNPKNGGFKADHDGDVHASVTGNLNGDIVKVDSISGKGETK